jgi:GNAT superfamily N-acetyltransferase
MSDPADCASSRAQDPTGVVLPTRQMNALRLLLNKSSVSPHEVAALDVHVIERAPGIGRKSLELIEAWLRSQGCQLAGLSNKLPNRRLQQKQRKLEQAIDLLRGNGYEVRRPP